MESFHENVLHFFDLFCERIFEILVFGLAGEILMPFLFFCVLTFVNCWLYIISKCLLLIGVCGSSTPCEVPERKQSQDSAVLSPPHLVCECSRSRHTVL